MTIHYYTQCLQKYTATQAWAIMYIGKGGVKTAVWADPDPPFQHVLTYFPIVPVPFDFET